MGGEDREECLQHFPVGQSHSAFVQGLIWDEGRCMQVPFVDSASSSGAAMVTLLHVYWSFLDLPRFWRLALFLSQPNAAS